MMAELTEVKGGQGLRFSHSLLSPSVNSSERLKVTAPPFPQSHRPPSPSWVGWKQRREAPDVQTESLFMEWTGGQVDRWTQVDTTMQVRKPPSQQGGE